jgi:hypothetical protein
LAESKGVICPPPTADKDIELRPPPTGDNNMPAPDTPGIPRLQPTCLRNGERSRTDSLLAILIIINAVALVLAMARITSSAL